MENKQTAAGFEQLFLRIALAVTLLSAVADRFGAWGAKANWGNWSAFLSYSRQLTFYLPSFLTETAAVIATVAEVVLALLLLFGFKAKAAAIATGILLLVFAVSMSFSVGLKATLDYSVWVGTAASFLLARSTDYRYSIDQTIKNK